MPETRLERAISVLGVLAMVVLALVVARSWHHTAAASAPTVVTNGQARTAPKTAPAAASATGTVHATTTASTAAIKLALTASRGATWIEVRAGSATGAVLYTGTLPSGTTKTFHETTIWVRFGAASNLAATLNSQPLRLPAGTYDAVFDTTGFKKARG